MVFDIAAPTDHRTLDDHAHMPKLFLERPPNVAAVQVLGWPLHFSRPRLDELAIYSERGIVDRTRSWSYTGEPTQQTKCPIQFSIPALVSSFSLEEPLEITTGGKSEL